MADPFGMYDKLVNTSYKNMPKWMRPQVSIELLRIYDNIWRPRMQELFPRAPAPSANGKPVSVDTPFFTSYGADPQTMSKFSDYFERPTARGVGYQKEEMQGRLMKEWGPTYNPLEYPNEWRNGFLDSRNQQLVQNAVRSMERKIEYELVNYALGDATFMNQFGNQYAKQINRMKKFDCRQTVTSATDYLTGKGWDEANSTPVKDIAKMKLYYNKFAQEDPKFGMIGANTAYALEINAEIIDLVKWHYDVTQRPIGASIDGVTFQKIIGLTYKDSSANAGKLGYPGLGDIRPDDWSVRNQIDMMTNTVSGTKYEFGIFASGPVGNTFMCACHPKHENVNTPYSHEWEDPEFEFKFSQMSLGICPYVNDFAKIMPVMRLAVANV
jgi:hypothetical protein